MAERPARVIVIAAHPGLEALPAALTALGVEVAATTEPEEIEWFLHSWDRACVAVLDATLPDAQAFASLHQRLHEAPPVPTLVVFDDRYATSPRELAPRDAHALLPATLDELVAAVAALLRRAEYTAPGLPGPEPPAAPRGPRGKAIVVFGLKGGVGRSTIAAHLAVSLAQRHSAGVVLVDADLWRGDLSVLLNLRLGRGMADLVPQGDDVVDLDAVRAMLQPHSSGVRLLSVPDEPTLVELIPPLLPARLVEVCKTEADYVVVDTAPALDDPTLHVLDVADRVLVVFTPEVSAARHACRLLRLAPHLGLEGRLLLVLNRANSGLPTWQVEEILGRHVDARIVSAGLPLLDAANRGRTLVEADPRLGQRITRDFARLAGLVVGSPDAAAEEDEAVATSPPKRAGLYTSMWGASAALTRRFRRTAPRAQPAPEPSDSAGD
ncbi:MAG TPA: P-loop NTPase [Chloroflexota bacterium]|jgi:pilus assembly protein CpaE